MDNRVTFIITCKRITMSIIIVFTKKLTLVIAVMAREQAIAK